MKFDYPSVDKITGDLNGFYRISHEAYHAGPGLSSTKVKKALLSYAHYSQEDTFDSAALAFGRAFHTALLEPNLYQAKYVEWTGSVRRGKAWDEFSQKHKNREIITEEEAAQIGQMIAAVKSHPEYAKLPKFEAEIMAITDCSETGYKLKCKADLFGHAIIDFKSTSSSVHTSDFLYELDKYRYHVSAAFYQDIITQLTGERMPFIAVPVTKKAPFECEFYELSDELLEEGRKLYKAALRRIKKWSEHPHDACHVLEKKLRKLYPSNKMMYSTQAILEFIEGS